MFGKIFHCREIVAAINTNDFLNLFVHFTNYSVSLRRFPTEKRGELYIEMKFDR